MSRSQNKIMLIGNVGSEPAAITTTTGVTLTTFMLATRSSYNDTTGEQHEETEWHHLTFFGRLAVIVDAWGQKGDRLYIEGRIQSHSRPRRCYDITAKGLGMLGSTKGVPARDEHRLLHGARYRMAQEWSFDSQEPGAV